MTLLYLHAITASHLLTHEFPRKQQVVVIGAGISGLGAAQILHKGAGNFIDVTVVEARDRIGGRIYTGNLGGEAIPVDLGASWIHGIGRGKKEVDHKGLWKGQWNPVYQIAKDHKIATSRTWLEDYKNINETFHMPETGSQYVPPRVWRMHDRIKDYVKSGKNMRQCRPDMSFQELVTTKLMPPRTEGTSQEDEEFAQFMMNYLYGLPNGADPSQVSAKLVNDYYKFRGEEHFINKGYGQICQILADAGFPIVLSTEAKAIQYTTPDRVSLETKCGKTYEGDHLIVTLPLGVLKSGDVKFEPPLPKSKLAAIERLGVSYLDKLYLEFEEVFWDPQVDLFNIIQDDWTLIVNCFKLHTRRPVLLLFNYGK